MKKLLLFVLFSITSIVSANAQCTADPLFTEPGIYPDSATGFDNACVDQLYEQLITVIVPVDTTTNIGPIPVTLPFDSVVVSDWQGLPTGFTYACSSPQNTISGVNSCSFEGGVTGCVMVTGTPTAAQIGSYQQTITTDAYLQGNPLGNPSTVIVDYYYIHIVDCTAGLNTITNSKFLVYPNPAKEMITLNGLNGIDVHGVSVIDMQGKVLKQYDQVNTSALDMDIDHFNEGMYFIRIDYDSTSETIKFVKQ